MATLGPLTQSAPLYRNLVRREVDTRARIKPMAGDVIENVAVESTEVLCVDPGGLRRHVVHLHEMTSRVLSVEHDDTPLRRRSNLG